MNNKLMVCTRCHLMPAEIKPIDAMFDISARATVKVDEREPFTLLIIPHRDTCTELTREGVA